MFPIFHPTKRLLEEEMQSYFSSCKQSIHMIYKANFQTLHSNRSFFTSANSPKYGRYKALAVQRLRLDIR